MKICVEPSLFADLVGRAARHTSGPIDPILAGILLQADNGTLTVSGLNPDTSLKTCMPAQDVAEPGRILLPGRVLADAAKSLAKRRDYLQIAATAAETTITCGSAEMRIRALPVDDYPALPEPAATVGFIDAVDLKDAVAQVSPACKSEKPVKPEHTAIRIDVDGDEITWVGADNYRMATRTTPWNPSSEGALAAHVPVRAFRDTVRDFGKGPIEFGVNDSIVSLAGDGQVVTIRQFQVEQYTAYKQRLATALPTNVTVDTEALLEAVRRVVLFADSSQDVTLDIRLDAIGVHAGDISLIGSGADTVPCTLDGEAMQQRFQPLYLLDGLEGVHTDKTTISMTAPGRYILITSSDQVFKYLVVPLRAR